jgi:hypothetical protein
MVMNKLQELFLHLIFERGTLSYNLAMKTKKENLKKTPSKAEAIEYHRQYLGNRFSDKDLGKLHDAMCAFFKGLTDSTKLLEEENK